MWRWPFILICFVATPMVAHAGEGNSAQASNTSWPTQVPGFGLTTEEAKKIELLAQTIVDARKWLETFAQFDDGYHEEKKKEVAEVVFGDFGLRKIGSSETNIFDGDIRMPREMAIAMMKWLEAAAVAELEAMGGFGLTRSQRS